MLMLWPSYSPFTFRLDASDNSANMYMLYLKLFFEDCCDTLTLLYKSLYKFWYTWRFKIEIYKIKVRVSNKSS